MTLKEKVAYIQGLVDGNKLDKNTKEGEIILALVDLVAKMADSISNIEEDVDTLNDYIEEVDEDLGALEEIVYEDDCCGCDCDCDCDDCDDYDDCELDEEYSEIVCPSCGETICFEGCVDPEELACPACGEKFECLVSEDDFDALNGDEDK